MSASSGSERESSGKSDLASSRSGGSEDEAIVERSETKDLLRRGPSPSAAPAGEGEGPKIVGSDDNIERRPSERRRDRDARHTRDRDRPDRDLDRARSRVDHRGDRYRDESRRERYGDRYGDESRRERDGDRRRERGSDRDRDYNRGRDSRRDQDARDSHRRDPDSGRDRPRDDSRLRGRLGSRIDGGAREASRESKRLEELPVARGRGALKGRAAAREAPDPPKAEVEDPAAKDEAPAQPKKIGKAGGAYIPPFRLAQMMQESESKTDASYQRLTWDALRKSINGLVNKANAVNIRPILKELLSENLFRGRGLFCQSIMKSQVASPSYTAVFAALVAVIGTRLPDIPTLLVNRLVAQFKRAFKRNDRALTSSVVTFLCHLANQMVVPTLLIAEILMVLLGAKTNDSVELAVTALKEAGALLQDIEPQMLRMIMDEMRQVLQEGQVEQRVQYLVEGLFKTQRDGFEKSGHPQIPQGLDLVEDAEKFEVVFDINEDVPDIQQTLNIFKFDDDYEQHEREYEGEKKKWFDEESDSEAGSGDESGSDASTDEEEEEIRPPTTSVAIQDQTETNLVNLRRTIYLTIMSSMDFEEAGHKLMKIELGPGQEMEIVTMLIECCSQEKTYLRYYGLLAQRYCGHHQSWQALYEECFRKQYAFVHRLETNKLRNVAKFFAHLLATDSISWAVLDTIRITEDDTTSSSRIFIKILFQDLAENMGLQSLNDRLQDPDCSLWFHGIFPKDTPRNMRFSINFFTSIGLGGLTDKMRAYLKELPKMLAAQQAAAAESSSDDSDSDSSSSDSDSDSDSSSSDSDSDSDSSSDSSSSDSSDSDSDTSSSGTEVEEPHKSSRTSKKAPMPKSPKAEPSRPPKSTRRSQRVVEEEPPAKRHRSERHREDRVKSSSRHRR